MDDRSRDRLRAQGVKEPKINQMAERGQWLAPQQGEPEFEEAFMALKKRVGAGWDSDFMLMFQNGRGYAFKSIKNRDYIYVS